MNNEIEKQIIALTYKRVSEILENDEFDKNEMMNLLRLIDDTVRFSYLTDENHRPYFYDPETNIAFVVAELEINGICVSAYEFVDEMNSYDIQKAMASVFWKVCQARGMLGTEISYKPIEGDSEDDDYYDDEVVF